MSVAPDEVADATSAVLALLHILGAFDKTQHVRLLQVHRCLLVKYPDDVVREATFEALRQRKMNMSQQGPVVVWLEDWGHRAGVPDLSHRGDWLRTFHKEAYEIAHRWESRQAQPEHATNTANPRKFWSKIHD